MTVEPIKQGHGDRGWLGMGPDLGTVGPRLYNRAQVTPTPCSQGANRLHTLWSEEKEGGSPQSLRDTSCSQSRSRERGSASQNLPGESCVLQLSPGRVARQAPLGPHTGRTGPWLQQE